MAMQIEEIREKLGRCFPREEADTIQAEYEKIYEDGGAALWISYRCPMFVNDIRGGSVVNLQRSMHSKVGFIEKQESEEFSGVFVCSDETSNTLEKEIEFDLAQEALMTKYENEIGDDGMHKWNTAPEIARILVASGCSQYFHTLQDFEKCMKVLRVWEKYAALCEKRKQDMRLLNSPDLRTVRFRKYQSWETGHRFLILDERVEQGVFDALRRAGLFFHEVDEENEERFRGWALYENGIQTDIDLAKLGVRKV